MVEKFYFVVCIIGLMVTCASLGWDMGYSTAKEKYRRRSERRTER